MLTMQAQTIPLRTVVAHAVDYLFEGLADIQRDMALLPSSSDADISAERSVDDRPGANKAAEEKKKEIAQAADKRRAALLTWTNKAISLLVQLYVCTAISTSSKPVDVSSENIGGISAAIRQTRRAIASLDASDSRYSTVLNTLGLIPMQMNRTAKPRYAIPQALHVFKHGILPLANMPGALYRGVESIAGARLSLDERKKILFRRQHAVEADVRTSLRSLQLSGKSFPTTAAPSIVARAHTQAGVPVEVAQRMQERFALLLSRTPVEGAKVDEEGYLCLTAAGLRCKLALGSSLRSDGKVTLHLLDVEDTLSANERGRGAYSITKKSARLALTSQQLQRASDSFHKEMGNVLAATEGADESLMFESVVQRLRSDMAAITEGLVWEALLTQLAQKASSLMADRVVTFQDISEDTACRIVRSQRNAWSDAAIGATFLKTHFMLPNAPPKQMVAATLAGIYASVAPATKDVATSETFKILLAEWLQSLRKYSKSTGLARYHGAVWRRYGVPKVTVPVSIPSNDVLSEAEASHGQRAEDVLSRAAVSWMRKLLCVENGELTPAISSEGSAGMPVVIDEMEACHRWLSSGTQLSPSLSFVNHLGLMAFLSPRLWSEEARSLMHAEGREGMPTRTTKTDELLYKDDDVSTSAVVVLPFDVDSGRPIKAPSSTLGDVNAAVSSLGALAPQGAIRLHATVAAWLREVASNPALVDATCELVSRRQSLTCPFTVHWDTRAHRELGRQAGVGVSVHAQYHYNVTVASSAAGRATTTAPTRQPFQRQVDQAIKAITVLSKQMDEAVQKGEATPDAAAAGKALIAPPLSTYFSACVAAIWSHAHLLGLTRSPLLTDKLQALGVLIGLSCCIDVISTTEQPRFSAAIETFAAFALPKLSARFHNVANPSIAALVTHILSPAVSGYFLNSGLVLDTLPPSSTIDLSRGLPWFVGHVSSPQALEVASRELSSLLKSASAVFAGKPNPELPATPASVGSGPRLGIRNCLTGQRNPLMGPNATISTHHDGKSGSVELDTVLATAQQPSVSVLLGVLQEMLQAKLPAHIRVDASNRAVAGLALTPSISLSLPEEGMLHVWVDHNSGMFNVEMEGTHHDDRSVVETVARLVHEIGNRIKSKLAALLGGFAAADKQLSEQVSLALRTQMQGSKEADAAPTRQAALDQSATLTSGLLNMLNVDIGTSLLLGEAAAPGEIANHVEMFVKIPSAMRAHLLGQASDATAPSCASSKCSSADEAVMLLRSFARGVRRPAGTFGSIDPGQVAGPLAASRDMHLLAAVSLIVSHQCDILALALSNDNDSIESIASRARSFAEVCHHPAALVALLRQVAGSSVGTEKDDTRLLHLLQACERFTLPPVSQLLHVIYKYTRVDGAADPFNAVSTLTIAAMNAKVIMATATVCADEITRNINAIYQAMKSAKQRRSTVLMATKSLSSLGWLHDAPSVLPFLRPRFVLDPTSCSYKTAVSVHTHTPQDATAGTKRRAPEDIDGDEAVLQLVEASVSSAAHFHSDPSRSVLLPLGSETATKSNVWGYSVAASASESPAVDFLLLHRPRMAPALSISVSVKAGSNIGRHGGAELIPLTTICVDNAEARSVALSASIACLCSAHQVASLIHGQTSRVQDLAARNFDGHIAVTPAHVVSWASNTMFKDVLASFGEMMAVEVPPQYGENPPPAGSVVLVELPSTTTAAILSALRDYPQEVSQFFGSSADTPCFNVFSKLHAMLQAFRTHGARYVVLLESALHVKPRSSSSPHYFSSPLTTAAWQSPDNAEDLHFDTPLLWYASGNLASALRRAATQPDMRFQFLTPLPQPPGVSAFRGVDDIQTIIALPASVSEASRPNPKRSRTDTGNTATAGHVCYTIMERIEEAAAAYFK